MSSIEIISILRILGKDITKGDVTSLILSLGGEYPTKNVTTEYFKSTLINWVNKNGENATIKQLLVCLEQCGFTKCSENLRRLTASLPDPVKISIPGLSQSETNTQNSVNDDGFQEFQLPFSYGVQPSHTNITGRVQGLQELFDIYQSDAPGILITGEAGIGKTEFVSKFINKLAEQDKSLIISYFSFENSGVFEQSLVEFCQKLSLKVVGADNKPLGVKQMLENVQTQVKIKWVIVLDNVDVLDNANEILKTLETAKVFPIIISRISHDQLADWRHIEFSPLSQEEGLEFVKVNLRNNPTDNFILKLCNWMGNHPLLLQLAVTYVQQCGFQMHELEAKFHLLFNDSRSNSETMTTLLNVIIQDIMKNKLEKLAVEILNVFGFLSGDVEQDMLMRMCGQFYPDFKERDFTTALDILTKYSLLKINSNDDFRMPKMIQEALRSRLFKRDSPAETGSTLSLSQPKKKRGLFSKLFRKKKHQNPTLEPFPQPKEDSLKLLTRFWKSFNPNDWTTNDQMRQILSIWKHSVSHPSLIQQISNTTVAISTHLYTHKMTPLFNSFTSEAYSVIKLHLGDEDSDAMLLEENLGYAFLHSGQFVKSLDTFKSLHLKQKSILGVDHPTTLNISDLISQILRELDRTQASFEWAQRTLEMRGEDRGKNAQNTLHNLALALINLRRYEESRKISEECLTWRRQHLGELDDSTVACKYNIAVSYMNERKYPDARDKYRAMLNEVPDGHAFSLRIKQGLASALTENREWTEAIQASKGLLEVQERSLGKDHPDTISTMNAIKVLGFFETAKVVKNAISPKIIGNLILVFVVAGLAGFAIFCKFISYLFLSD